MVTGADIQDFIKLKQARLWTKYRKLKTGSKAEKQNKYNDSGTTGTK